MNGLKSFCSLFLLITIQFFSTTIHAQTTVFEETFESNGQGVRYSANLYSDNGNDYLGITDNNGSLIYQSNTGGFNNPFSDFEGSQIFAGEDLDSDNPLGDTGYIVFATVDASSFGTMTISSLLAANSIQVERYENDDGIEIQYAFDTNIADGANSIGGLPTASSVNTGTYTTVGAFYGPTTGPPIGGFMAEDVDLDGPGGTRGDVLMNNMTNKSYSFPVSGTNLSIRIKLINNTGSEEVAIDHVILSGNAPVPVELVYFNADLLDDKAVQISWQTASEINSDYISIEKRMDEKHWESIYTVHQDQDRHEIRNYSFVDRQVDFGNNYYRLKQVDLDGSIQYSKVEQVHMANYNSIRIYPNPASTLIRIKSSPSYEIKKIACFDINQQLIFSSLDVDNPVDISALENGIYILKMYTSRGSFIEKMHVIH